MEIVCSNNLFITDSRPIISFKQTVFAGYAKTEVITLIEKKILGGHYESACYLAYILLISGHIKSLWEKLQLITYKKIRNHGLIKWFYYRNKYLSSIIVKYEKTSDYLHLRNSQLVRNIITEAVVLLTSATKKDQIELLKRKPNIQNDFEINHIYNELKHKDQMIINNLIGPNDPKEVCFIANEIAHCLNNKNIQKSMYWIEWLLLWEKQNIVKFKKFEVQSREINGIAVKWQTNIIWLIWCILLYIKSLMEGRIRAFYGNNFDDIIETLDYIWMSYLYDWKPTLRNKKMILVYLYINYMLNPQDFSINICGISNGEYLKITLLLQEKLFGALKKQTITDGTHFMLNNYLSS